MMKKKLTFRRRQCASTDYLKFVTDFKHMRLRYVIQWRVQDSDRWISEQFEYYTDFENRVAWFRFHNDSFKIRTFVKCIALKAIDV